MPTPISPAEAQQRGIAVNHERMDNGEVRYRLCAPDGTSYIRSENPGGPVWENSHSHAKLQEMVVVQRGEIVYAELRGGNVQFQRLRAGEYIVTVPGVPHNACVGEGAVVHTVKFGDCTCPDWIASPELDAYTKELTFAQAQQHADAEQTAD